MPTYDYVCDSCGRRFERFQSMSDAPVKTCPECGGTVRRLIGTGAGVLVRGTPASRANPDSSGPTRCGRERPCCGRDVPCDSPPCE